MPMALSRVRCTRFPKRGSSSLMRRRSVTIEPRSIWKSAYQTPLTVKDVVEKIHRKEYLLPAIQREFVWEPEQIVKLFDSLMRGYPISSFLFWDVSKEKIKDFQFYEFITNYHNRDSKH